MSETIKKVENQWSHECFCEVLSTGKYKANHPFKYITQGGRGKDVAGESS